jgi:hypothetical protein
MLIAVSSFGKGLRWEFLTEPAEAVFYLLPHPPCPPSLREGGMTAENE